MSLTARMTASALYIPVPGRTGVNPDGPLAPQSPKALARASEPCEWHGRFASAFAFASVRHRDRVL